MVVLALSGCVSASVDTSGLDTVGTATTQVEAQAPAFSQFPDGSQVAQASSQVAPSSMGEDESAWAEESPTPPPASAMFAEGTSEQGVEAEQANPEIQSAEMLASSEQPLADPGANTEEDIASRRIAQANAAPTGQATPPIVPATEFPTAPSSEPAEQLAEAEEPAAEVAVASAAQDDTAAEPVSQESIATRVASAAPAPSARVEPRRSGIFGLFNRQAPQPPANVGSASAQRDTADEDDGPTPLMALADTSSDEDDSRTRPRVVATARATGASAGGLPGVDRDRAIGVPSGGSDPSRPVQLASAAGLARLAPNGLQTQHDGVDIKCLKPALVRVLDKVESKYGKPVVVTSGYRSPSRNSRARGAKQSLHMYCAAADIQVDGVSKWELAKYLREMPGRGGVGTYCHTQSVHIDIGPRRDWNWRC